MRSVLTTLTAGLALSFSFASSIYASEEAAHGDAEAGKAKTAVCTACHMADGNSVVPTFPKIAGQQPGYIAKQLADFKSGARSDDTMKGMVAALSGQDMLDLDAYYSSQTQSSGEISQDQEEAALAGQQIYRAGLAKFSVTACMACHGPAGKGIQPNYPRLSGQHATYIEKQLLAFKDGSRSDPMMNDIAFPLNAEQIKNLAVYISGLY
ncbi:MAG: cytochrome c [Proteobacteria bacterium]|nr:cytochrome c [Pseudomonadota bacterium]